MYSKLLKERIVRTEKKRSRTWNSIMIYFEPDGFNTYKYQLAPFKIPMIF